MKTSTLLPAQNNFADLREQTDKLLKRKDEESLTRLIAIVGKVLYRCDLLEREVERLGRGVPAPKLKNS